MSIDSGVSKELVQQIFSILTKRRYNRGLPNLEKKVKQVIETAIADNASVKLVGFWGTGPKSHANWADIASCEFLSALNDEVREVYPPGIEFTFIFATLHGVHNGYDRTIIDSYTKDMEKLFAEAGFKFLYLDVLWDKYGISFNKVDDIWHQKSKGWWLEVENAATIVKNAENRNIRLPAEVAAQKYFVMRDLEKHMLETEFKGSIFHVFSDPDLKNVLPSMPTLYFYAREGWSDTPWFVTGTRTTV